MWMARCSMEGSAPVPAVIKWNADIQTATTVTTCDVILRYFLESDIGDIPSRITSVIFTVQSAARLWRAADWTHFQPILDPGTMVLDLFAPDFLVITLSAGMEGNGFSFIEGFRLLERPCFALRMHGGKIVRSLVKRLCNFVTRSSLS